MRKDRALQLIYECVRQHLNNEMENTFESPSGFYRLNYPDDFDFTFEENVLNVFPKDGESALTISSYYSEDIINYEKFEEMFIMFTENKNPISERIEVNENNWFQQFEEFTKNQKLKWTMSLNKSNHVMLAISINYPESESEDIIDKYQGILNSIVNNG
jgi:hypothetical protein